MRFNALYLKVWFAAIAAVAPAGCGGKAATVQTEYVEGLVTLDGQPVSGATVTFVPVQGSSGASATGLSDSEGKYRLTAIGAGTGAPAEGGTLPGEYCVGVSKVVVPHVQTEQEKQAALGSNAAAAVPSGERPKDVELTYVVPQKFNDPQKSNIKVTVKPGKNDIPIPLVSK